jgi:APA family basic amino acid/polyamine antiporter
MDPSGAAHAKTRLDPTIGLLDVVMLGAGSALGFSIFSVLTPAAQIAGSGILVTIAIAAIPMIVFGLVYATLASIHPCSGASFEWPRTYLHPAVGFMVSWLRIFGSVGQITTIALVLVHYVTMVVPVPETPSIFILFMLVFLINLGGLRVAAGFQSVLMMLLIISFVIFAIAGAPHIVWERITPLMPQGISPILLAAPVMVSLFMGIESATEVGEEVVSARRNVPLGIALALLLIGAIYFAVAFTTLGLIGPEKLAHADAPLVDAARVSLGRFALPLVVGAAVIALIKSLNASFLIFARSFFAMARAGLMPARFADLRGGNALPASAVFAAFLCTCFGLLMPRGLIFLFLASNIPLILKYLSTSLCALQVARRHRALLATSSLGLSPRLVAALATIGVVMALILFLLGYASDWRPYAMVAGWAILGLIYWLFYPKAPSPGARTEPDAPMAAVG